MGADEHVVGGTVVEGAGFSRRFRGRLRRSRGLLFHWAGPVSYTLPFSFLYPSFLYFIPFLSPFYTLPFSFLYPSCLLFIPFLSLFYTLPFSFFTFSHVSFLFTDVLISFVSSFQSEPARKGTYFPSSSLIQGEV